MTYQTEQTNVTPRASLGIRGANGTTVTESLSIGTVGTVQESIVTADLTAPLEFNLSVRGVDARVQVSKNGTAVDSDGDGITDRLENQTWRMSGGLGWEFSTSPFDKDTDDDGLTDSQEITITRASKDSSTRYVARTTSDPTRRDTDLDGLDDATEYEGWSLTVSTATVSVAASAPEKKYGNRSDLPVRWDPTGGARLTASSNPLLVDTDGDGAVDSTEKRSLHTDPSARITYGVTVKHVSNIIEPLEGTTVARKVGIQAAANPVFGGTDSTDDFDFVVANPNRSGVERIRFRALDGESRTDTWVTNVEEAGNDTDPWDPDTDDDGLTDGQELAGLTKVERCTSGLCPSTYTISKSPIATSPTESDTDRDGYWDGWIGVYDVGRTSNVVLYRHNLEGGIRGGETIPEQIGVHRLDPGSRTIGARIFGPRSPRYHSNVHIGERIWETDPTGGSEPSPSLTIEVDFYAGSNLTLWGHTGGGIRSAWVQRIEQNYRLYGIEVDLQPDELVNTSDLPPDISLPTVLGEVKLPPDDGKAPFSLGDLIIVAADNNDQPSDQYMFVANRSDFPASLEGRTQTGINFYFAGGAIKRPLASLGTDVLGIHVFADAPIHRGNATRARKTAIHEIAHSFQIGEADDDCFRAPRRAGEIYSATRKDKTREQVKGETTWSIMGRGWQNEMTIPPMNGRYFSFSIEELFTITTEAEAPCIPDYYDEYD